MDKLQKRVLDISKELHLSHIGSNLSILPILEEIYNHKADNDIVILDNAHAHLAHLVIKMQRMEEEAGETPMDEPIEALIRYHGIHCDREARCDASGGSLGHGIGISIGYAMIDRKRAVHCVVSDGSMMEGSNWEALRIKEELKLDNLHIYCNFNGYSAVQNVNLDKLISRVKSFCPSARIFHTNNTDDFDGVEGHYKTI